MPLSLATTAPCEHAWARRPAPGAGASCWGRLRFGEAMEESSLKSGVSPTFGDRVTHASRTPMRCEPSRGSFENHKRTTAIGKNVSLRTGRK